MSLTSRIYHPNGECYDIPASLVVVYAPSGQAVATTYVENGVTLHCDVTSSDWESTCKRLGIPLCQPPQQPDDC